MGSVKTPKGTETVAERIRLIRRRLNPHGDGELPWPDFARFAGVPLGTAKKWESRDGISHDSAVQLAGRLADVGLACTPEWVRLGSPPIPAWGDDAPVPAPHGIAPSGDERVTKKVAAVGLAAWLSMGREMQHNVAVKVIKEALEAQDFVGSPVLRALHGIAEKMQEMGYTAMSRHIWAEMGKYFGQQIPDAEDE